MTLAYIPPGVTVQELTTPSVAPLLALPGSVCLVGMSNGVITRTDSVTLTGTTPVVLPGVPAGSTMTSASIVSVIDAINPSIAPGGYSGSTDYTFTPGTYTIVRQNSGVIPSGNVVFVTYTYTPADYFSPIRLNNMGDIESRFGTAWDPTGTVVGSPLSHAAMVAFENGASNVVLQPLFFFSGGLAGQPTAAQAAAPATWTTVFNSLQDIQDINIVVPVVGQSMANVTDAVQLQILQTAQDFVFLMLNTNDQYLIAVLGEDSSASSTVAQESVLQTHATTIAARYGNAVTEQLSFINTSNFSRANSVSSFSIGGQYVASAVAGMLASRNPSATLTRQAVSGFLNVLDARTKAQKNTDASLGMLVVESKGNVVQVRHAITMDTTTVATRELNVVRGKHFVIESVRNTLDTQIIGRIVADAAAPTLVNNVVIATLEDLRGLGDISDYANVQSRILSLDPTAMEVRFSYSPAFTVNYINVAFSLDLTAQTVLVSSTGSSQ